MQAKLRFCLRNNTAGQRCRFAGTCADDERQQARRAAELAAVKNKLGRAVIARWQGKHGPRQRAAAAEGVHGSNGFVSQAIGSGLPRLQSCPICISCICPTAASQQFGSRRGRASENNGLKIITVVHPRPCISA